MSITVNETIGKNDSESITLAIKKAKEEGVNSVLIPKLNERTGENKWVIEETIYLPSDIEIIIDNAFLVLADNVYANMFANEKVKEEGERTLSDEQKNITIRGVGGACLSGGNYNGLSESTSLKNGLPHISKNTMILMVNVRNLTVENIRIEKQRWWGITNICVRDSVFRNINFCADLSRIDENGVHYENELPRNYGETYIKNADGLDLRVGCNNILIENITGFTEDDSVALTALGGFETRLGYIVTDKETDIHDVKIRNVATDSYICSNVRLLNENGHKIYNIDIDGVTDMRKRNEYKSQYNVRIGDSADAYAKTRHSVMGEIYNISVRNVYGNGSYAVGMCKFLKDSLIDNIIGGEECVVGFGFYHTHLKKSEMDNVTIGNVLCNNKKATPVFLENDREKELLHGTVEV